MFIKDLLVSNITLGAIHAVVAKMALLIAGVLTMREGVAALGAAPYGVWLTISAAISVFQLADIGIGNQVIREVALADSKQISQQLSRSLTASVIALALSALAVALMLIVVIAILGSKRVVGAEAITHAGDLWPTIGLGVFVLVLSIPMGLFTKIQIGTQSSSRASLASILGSFTTYLLVLVSSRLALPTPLLCASMASQPLLTGVFSAIDVLFIGKLPRPIICAPGIGIIYEKLKQGSMYWALQIAALLGVASDNLVLSHILGAEAVTEFNAISRLFQATILCQFLVGPLLPAYTTAISRGKIEWVRHVFITLTSISLALSAILAGVIAIGSDLIVQTWLKIIVNYSNSLLIGCVAWVILSSMTGMITPLLNAANMIREQVVWFATATIVSIVLKFLLIPYQGIAGVIWATVIGYGLVFLVPMAPYIAKLLTQSKSSEK
jgi:O-antigen/teichoic acid export membrane protein